MMIIDTEFKTNIFLSNVSFCLKRKNDDSIKWSGIEYLSTKLGTLKYPLFKFAYDYIIFQYLDLVAVKNKVIYIYLNQNLRNCILIIIFVQKLDKHCNFFVIED